VGYLFLSLVFWWWWEFGLGDVGVWTFQLYLFVVLYAVLMFLTASILFPDSLEEYDGYRDYFYSRRVWLFCLLGVIGLTDYAHLPGVLGAAAVRDGGLIDRTRTHVQPNESACATLNRFDSNPHAKGGVAFDLHDVRRFFAGDEFDPASEQGMTRGLQVA
jgi:hypothetical protein